MPNIATNHTITYCIQTKLQPAFYYIEILLNDLKLKTFAQNNNITLMIA